MPVCTRRNSDLSKAIEAYSSQEPCQWHITKDELIELQEILAIMKNMEETV